MKTSLYQLKHMGVLDAVSGVLLGTFTQMERDQLKPAVEEIILELLPEHTPLAVTPYIGHGHDARAITIGRYMKLEEPV